MKLIRRESEMDRSELLQLLNDNPLELDKGYILSQIEQMEKQIGWLEQRIRQKISEKVETIPVGFLKDYYQKEFINQKILGAKRVGEISLKILEELYAETDEEYFYVLIKYQK
jgi:hypothetical protein